MEKELENLEKKKRRKQPTRPTKPSQVARPRARDARLSATVLPRARPPSLARCPVGPTCRRQFPSPVLSLPLSVSRARFASVEPLPPRVPFSLSTSWACLVSSAFPALAVDQRVRTRARRRISRPRRPPTRPAPFLEPRQCPAHTPRHISLGFTLSRALSTPPATVRDPRPRSRPSSSLETAPSLPEIRPEVRHCPRAQFSLLRPVFSQFHLRRWPVDLAQSSSLE
jgi:hypothetical protein